MPKGLLPRDNALVKPHRQKYKSAARAARSKRLLAVNATQESLVKVISPPAYSPSPIRFPHPRLVRAFKAA